MKFEVKNRFTGEVQFTAEIEADDSSSYGFKLGLAVKWGVANKANLSGADLSGADLSRADLSRADLSRADLSDADLSRTYLSDADLSDANLSGAIGNNNEIRSMQLDIWNVTFTKDILQIGCQRYTHEEWMNFEDQKIERMHVDALAWWNKWKEFIFKAIDLSFN